MKYEVLQVPSIELGRIGGLGSKDRILRESETCMSFRTINHRIPISNVTDLDETVARSLIKDCYDNNLFESFLKLSSLLRLYSLLVQIGLYSMVGFSWSDVY